MLICLHLLEIEYVNEEAVYTIICVAVLSLFLLLHIHFVVNKFSVFRFVFNYG